MKTDRKKSVFLAICAMAVGIFCTKGAVSASVLEMPQEVAAGSAV